MEKIGASAVPSTYKDPLVATIAEQVRRYDRKHVQKAVSFSQRFIIDPRSSMWIGWWDAIISISLVFTALCTPVEVGFLSIPPNKWKDPLFLVNRLVDIVFLLDMMLQFVLMYNPNSIVSNTSSSSGWVDDARQIARHYLFSRWFCLEVIHTLSTL